MTNCPAKYTHIQTSNFGDKKKITEELLRSLCGNDAYLNKKVKELFDLSDPITRKRFNPIILDEAKSFGVKLGRYNKEDVYMFDNNESQGETINISFSMNSDDDRYQDDLLDLAKTTAHIDAGQGYALCPTVTKTVLDKSTSCTHRPDKKAWRVNAYWYVGYDKSKNYNLKKEYLNNEYVTLPAVCRAQTFKVVNGGSLESITLKIRTNRNTGSPLTVEIRETVASGKKKGYPSKKVLARQKVTFNESTEAAQAIRFDKPAKVESKKTYAVVLRSPLSTYDKCYWVAGWGANCNVDPYPEGSSYLSEDNGYSWTKHGKSEKVQYRDGKHAPVEFAFECHIRQSPTTEYKSGAHWVYLKPLHINPLKKVEVYSEANTNGGTIVYQVSRNGKNWITLDESNNYAKDWGSNVKLTPFLFVRVKLVASSDRKRSPTLSHLTVITHTVTPYSAYARSVFYYPEQSAMLSADIWNEVNAPYLQSDEETTVAVDIIRNSENRIHYKLLEDTVNDLYGILDEDYVQVDTTNYTYDELKREALRKFVGRSYLTEYQQAYPSFLSDSDFATAISSDKKMQSFLCENHAQYAEEGTSFIDYLETQNAYIVGAFNLDYATGEQLVRDGVAETYFKKIQLPDSPAYPLINVSLTPDSLYDVITEKEAILYLVAVITDTETLEEEMSVLDDYSEEQLHAYWETDKYHLVPVLEEENIFIEGLNTDDEAISSEQIAYSEWLDYDVDYENNTLRFFTNVDDVFAEEPGLIDDVEILRNLSSGELVVEYNPLWVKGLTSEDMPLKMDLWIEEFVVSAEEYVNQTLYDEPIQYMTRVAPRDNIRQVLIFEDTDDEQELIEGVDFTVDYLRNLITFNTSLDEDTPVSIRYTPNLVDDSLAIAYRLERENVNSQVYLQGNYFSTRT